MVRSFYFLTLFCCFVAMSACSQPENFDAMVAEMTTGSVEFAYPDDVDKNTVLLDAREKEEFEVSRIDGALWVGYDEVDLSVLKDVDPNAEVIVYCSVGYRSEKIAEQVKEMGYTNVKNLYGGIFNWKNTSHPVVNDKGTTEKVHTYNEKWGQWLYKGEKVTDIEKD